MKTPQIITDARSVVDAIGRKHLEDTLRTTPQNISNWIAKDEFPPDLFVVMSKMLIESGCHADPRLWGQKKTHRGEAA